MQNRKRKDELQPNEATLARIVDRHSVLLSQLLLRKLSKRLDQSVLSGVEVSQRSLASCKSQIAFWGCCLANQGETFHFLDLIYFVVTWDLSCFIQELRYEAVCLRVFLASLHTFVSAHWAMSLFCPLSAGAVEVS